MIPHRQAMTKRMGMRIYLLIFLVFIVNVIELVIEQGILVHFLYPGFGNLLVRYPQKDFALPGSKVFFINVIHIFFLLISTTKIM